MEDKQDLYLQHEINALRTSHHWATLGIAVVVLLALAGLGWATDHYFGPPGVRVLLVGAGLLTMLGIIFLMSISVSAVYGRQAQKHHDNILQGLIAFQRTDDYGEVARQVATGMSGAIRSGNTLDSRVLTMANQLAKQQTAAILTTERQQITGPTWAMADDNESNGQFKQID